MGRKGLGVAAPWVPPYTLQKSIGAYVSSMSYSTGSESMRRACKSPGMLLVTSENAKEGLIV